jgi:hypothetical protein
VKITAYDITLRVRYSGENTDAEGWIELDGERVPFRAEADVSSRGTTYTVGDESYWWSEVPEIDEWFEERWLEAAAEAGYDLENEIDFDARLTSESEEV